MKVQSIHRCRTRNSMRRYPGNHVPHWLLCPRNFKNSLYNQQCCTWISMDSFAVLIFFVFRRGSLRSNTNWTSAAERLKWQATLQLPLVFLCAKGNRVVPCVFSLRSFQTVADNLSQPEKSGACGKEPCRSQHCRPNTVVSAQENEKEKTPGPPPPPLNE